LVFWGRRVINKPHRPVEHVLPSLLAKRKVGRYVVSTGISAISRAVRSDSAATAIARSSRGWDAGLSPRTVRDLAAQGKLRGFKRPDTPKDLAVLAV